MRQIIYPLLTACLCLPAWLAPAARGQQTTEAQDAQQQSRSSQLDEQLLEDLGVDLLEGLDDLPASQPKPPQDQQRPETGKTNVVDEQLLKQLEGGEDIASDDPADRLMHIGQRMRMVEALIAQRNTSATTQQLQQRIVDDLEELIQQVKKQCAAGQSLSQGSQTGQKSSTGAADAGNKPAADSTNRLGKADPSDEVGEDRQALFKEVWGHLPERVREQMRNASVEEFLPKYARLIEEYYKRLAEDAQNGL